ncbi:MAG TPA: glycoside hydrolase family 31 protein [Ignavibacteriaceae bacterium]|nr:glycoside hydrolase family 31 protein [Ignavibacteriaceae bacterium]
MLKKIFLIVIMAALIKSTYADFQFAGDVISAQKFDNMVAFKLNNALFNLYVISDDIIRFRFTNKEEFSGAPSYAVIYNSSGTFSYSDHSDYYEIATKKLIVRVAKSPCRVSIYDNSMNLLNEDEKSFGVSFDADEVRCFKTLFKDELFYGLGEKTGSLKKNGEQWTMWNSDTPDYTERQDPLYQSIPFFIGIRNHKAYGIFFDNTYRSYFNMGASNNRFYWFGAEKGELDYYFINGPEIKKVISLYTLLTGRMELPPMWALGYQQSKWSYYPESTVQTLAQTFRDKKIPCDVIYLDIHYMNGYRVFTWDNDRFPDPNRMLNELGRKGFKVVTIIDPGVKADTNDYSPAKEGLERDLFAKYPDGVVYQGQVWPGWAYFPDFTKKETREWWGKQNAELLKQGIAGIWNDMNEPSAWGQAIPDIIQFDDYGFGASYKKIHNVYALEMAKATFEGIKNNLPGRRPFILTRAGFSGIQRYAAVWTGDNAASEVHLKLACTMVQGLSLSGVAFCGSDVGGFFGSPSQRLYTRWMELGAFTPFYRGHTIINTRDQEPWAFGEEVERWVTSVMNLRYEMLPFFYTEFYNASKTGVPIVRSMFLNYQDDDQCYSNEAQYQYMIGDNLLVAPVLSEFENSKKLYLPEGKWLGWWDNKVYEGRQWILSEAPIDRIPLFVREGGIIPMQKKLEYVTQNNKDVNFLMLKIFPGENSKYELYQDDGSSLKYQEGDYLVTNITVNNNPGLDIKLEKKEGEYVPEIGWYVFNIYRTEPVKSVTVNGIKLKLFADSSYLDRTEAGYEYNTEKKTLVIKYVSKGHSTGRDPAVTEYEYNPKIEVKVE